jgi:hypothetical protein
MVFGWDDNIDYFHDDDGLRRCDSLRHEEEKQHSPCNSYLSSGSHPLGDIGQDCGKVLNNIICIQS